VDQLNCLVDPKNAFVLRQMGGIEGLAESLSTNLDGGLNDLQTQDSERIIRYDRNELPQRKSKSLLQLMWIALQDKVLIILSVAAIISLALGLYETFGQPTEYDAEGKALPKVEWVEGVAILVAVGIVVMVGAGNDWQKERQFVKLNRKKEDRKVKVLRNGAPCEISVFDLLVGDIMLVEPGEMIPADGVLVRGYHVKCDESSASGESATMTKHAAEQVVASIDEDAINTRAHLNPQSRDLDAFMLSGAKVLEGTGAYLVTAVGPNSLHGRTMMSLQEDAEATPLQEKLNKIAEGIAKLGFAAALVLFTALMIRFFVELNGSTNTPAQKAEQFMNVFIVSVTIIVVAVPEGLPLAVTLALAFATTRMVRDNNLVRVLKSCETMGGATTVCSDKTGTLTQNRMSVVAATLGSGATCFVPVDEPEDVNEKKSDDKNINDENTTTPVQVLEQVPSATFKLLLDSIAINSTAFEDSHPDATELFVGSKTETALLGFAKRFMNLGKLTDYRTEVKVIQVYPFDSARKFMATIIQKPDGGYRLLVKGASEVVLSKCTSILDRSTYGERDMSSEDNEFLSQQITNYSSRSLRTIGLVYKDMDEVPTDDTLLFRDFTFIGLVGIMDPLRPGVRQAVQDCKTAGVVVRMVTGDNINTARAIAVDCGILTGDENEIVMEGPEFRKLNPFELKRIVPRLFVLARSSPQDKRKLVKFLKEEGETVAVTGDGTNDAPALKLADVGFSMGIAGTEVAKEASEIILMDDNFGSIVKAIKWGRTVNDAVKKFLQFQLTVNITAVILTFISAVADSENTSVLTAVQLLWVNLIMDSFAALALATDPPSDSVLYRKPDNRKKSLLTPTMWKMILGQAIFQLIVTFVLHFAGPTIFNLPNEGSTKVQLASMVFNTFVWMQFFNMFVNRRLDNRQNIFEGIHRNEFFMVIAFIIGGGQVLIMFIGGAAFSIHRQTGAMWAVALICGLMSIPMGCLLRLVPDQWVIKLYPARFVRWLHRLWKRVMPGKSTPEITVFTDEESTLGERPRYIWNPAIEQVRQELVFLKRVRGGRLSGLNFKPKKLYRSWKESRSPSTFSLSNGTNSPTSTFAPSPILTGSASPGGNFLTVPGRFSGSRSRGSSIAALTMVPVVVGGAVGGWSPGVANPADRSKETP
jgi:Ca2+-transporting ATPase